MAYVNMAAIAADEFDSDHLGTLDSVAHPFAPGSYRGEVWNGDHRVGSFELQVEDNGDGEQVDVDLCALPMLCSNRLTGGAARGFPVYAVFHCGGERAGLHVVVYAIDERQAVFDSRSLGNGDYYIVTPVRPGNWSMRAGKGGKGTLVVNEPKPSPEPRSSASGATIKVDREAFSPAKASIVAGDGVAFEVTGDSVSVHLKLEPSKEKGKKGRRPIGYRVPGRRDVRVERPRTTKSA